MNFGVIGTGAMAHTMMRAFRAIPEAQAIAVASRSEDRALQFARSYGLKHHFGTVASLADNNEVDVVYVASHPMHHLSDCLAALQAGKAVLCEKPLATSVAEAERLAEAALNNGVFLMEGMWIRFLPAVRRAEELIKAQETGSFTFVMFHYSPYTSGFHGRFPGEGPRGDILSSQPLKALTPLFIRHGVDAVFGGHGEMYEHSLVSGTEVTPGGIERMHDIHFYDVGIGGDGLRGPVKGVTNHNRVFLAHSDSPETYGPDGVLSGGGKHYGHLEVNVEQSSDGVWQARMDAVYIFPVLAADGRLVDFERRVYDDTVTLTAH